MQWNKMAGTSNISERKQNEDIVQFLENASPLKKIESKYQRVRVKDIQQGIDFSACILKGVIIQVHPSFETSRGCSKKLAIRDFHVCNQSDPSTESADPRDIISVFLKGRLVEKCKLLKEKDLILISGAKIKKSSKEGHELSIIANESKEQKIWVIQNPEDKHSDILSETEQKVGESGTVATVKKVHKKGEIEPPSKRRRLALQSKAEMYQYTRLADLIVNTLVNVYGVVKFFKSPFKTKGSDFVCTISLVDPSFDSLDQGFKCVLFSKCKESLPLVKSVGDVVRFHHLGVGQYRSDLQGKLMPETTWTVFDFDAIDSPRIRASSSKSQVLTDSDKELIEELRLWATHKETLNKKFAFTSLQDLNTSQSFLNLLCQVVSKSYTVNSDGIVLTLWDGSMPACQSFLVEPISEQGQKTSDELMRKAMKRCVEVFLYDDHVMGDVRWVCPGDFICIRNVHLKEIESDAKVTTDKTKLPHSRPLVSLEVHKGTICGRGVEILSPNDPVVTLSAMMNFIAEAETCDIQREQCDVSENERMEKNKRITPHLAVSKKNQENVPDENKGGHQNSVAANLESRALQTSCTITEHPCIPFTSLKDIRSCATVPNKFRCRVKALMFLPSDVRNFVRRSCQPCRYICEEHSERKSAVGVDSSTASVTCPHCGQETTLVYLFSFVIEDESTLLHAMVFDKDVTTFFPDLPSPQDFLEQPHVHGILGEWMLSMTQNPGNSLGFVNRDVRCDKRPWLELCILSYFPQENGGSKEVLYRVFDSTFVADS